MKIALSQLDYHIGNFIENSLNISLEIKKAEEFGMDLVVFSELSICGYPPLDLLERRDFIERCEDEVIKIARLTGKTAVIIGGPSVNPNPEGKMLFNSAYFLHEGKIREIVHKTLLPTYDIFDEYRYFEPGREFRIIDFKNKKIALTICEDLWDEQPIENYFGKERLYTVHPDDELMKLGADIIINIAASPFSHTRISIKKDIFINKARKYKVPVIYLNQVGAQTQLLFDGGSMAIDRNGNIAEQLKYFTEDTRYIDTDELTGNKNIFVNEIPDRVEMIHNALIMGIKGYFSKSGFTKAVLGLSGGIDSAVTTVLAVRALGNKNVHVLLLPSAYSSDHSVKDSVLLAQNLGIAYDIISIEELFRLFNTKLSPVFKDPGQDITEENIQSRIRAIFLMAYSNKKGHILLNTSNKSEASVGYGTLYGDMSGGLSVLGDVYKMDVYELARFINREKSIIPENILSKAPSAELKPDQKDSDSLPDYGILDTILQEYIELQKPVEEIIKKGFAEDVVRKVVCMVNSNEYKRYQFPPVLRISSKAFGEGRKLPLVARY
jgi:NAD+ synthase (glutamine-hydrolysing)